MDHKELYHTNSFSCSKITTQNYSTSFTMGIRLFHKKLHMPIYAIYAYVRFADEVVDTFINEDSLQLLHKYKSDTFEAIEKKFSANPIIHSFQQVVNQYNINHELIHDFINSMLMDVDTKSYQKEDFSRYVYGSAEVIGLMCLAIFLDGNTEKYKQLEYNAKKLGEAFQKINFLRDMKSDMEDRGRIYFPGINFHSFSEKEKETIIADIESDMSEALEGIKKLPVSARHGVYLSYVYYRTLLKKISKIRAEKILTKRIRIPNTIKAILFLSFFIKSKL